MNEYKVLIDGAYDGGLSWLYTFGAEIEPLAEFEDGKAEGVLDAYYIVRIPKKYEGAWILEDCDAVVEYEAI